MKDKTLLGLRTNNRDNKLKKIEKRRRCKRGFDIR